MTDKQIIIDEIDVSGCRFYSEKLSTMNGTGSISVTKCNGFCTHNIRGLDDSSCYDAHIEYAKCKNNNCYYKQLLRIEQECEELTSKCSQLKQTLTEIKEICNNNDELKGNFNLVDCDKYKQGKHNLAQKIIAKINKVENEL